VSSKPTDGLGPVLANLDPHVAYRTRLELDGVMFAAGPLAGDDLQEWLGEGLFVHRASSMEQARGYAEADPMHACGARSFSTREWLLDEGTLSVQRRGRQRLPRRDPRHFPELSGPLGELTAFEGPGGRVGRTPGLSTVLDRLAEVADRPDAPVVPDDSALWPPAWRGLRSRIRSRMRTDRGC
jgi:uncharacterized protein